MERGSSLVYTGRIQKGDLIALPMIDAEDPVSGRLGFGGDNGDLCVKDSIQKGGFTYVWGPYDGDETK
jgi:hypothetical protein